MATAGLCSPFDLYKASKIVYQVVRAFQRENGASSKYAAQVAFLKSLGSALTHLRAHAEGTAKDDISPDISSLLEDVRKPWEEFEKYTSEYEASLASFSKRAWRQRIPRTIKFTFEEMAGKVDRLREKICQPLQAINSLLLLQTINTLQKIQDHPLRPEQCAQLVEAIRLADIPAELDKQIKMLQQAADEHSVRQDDQLQNIISIRTKLEQMTSDMNDVLDVLKTDFHYRRNRQDLIGLSNAHIGRLSRLLRLIEGGELEKAIKDQQKTIDALRSFLEDKVSASRKEKVEDKTDAPNWPSATLTAAYLAATLFSSVVSVCTARTVSYLAFPYTGARMQELIESRKKYRISADGRVNVDTLQASSALSEESVSARKVSTTLDGNSQDESWPVSYENWIYEYRMMASPRAPSRSATSSLAQLWWDTAPDSRMSKLSEPYPDYDHYDPGVSDSDGS